MTNKKTLTCIAMSVTLGSIVASVPAEAAKMSSKQQLSYTIGVQLGKQFKAHGISLSSSSLARGFNDAYKGRKLKMSDKAMMNTMNAFRQQAAAKAQKKMAQESLKNLNAGQKFLKANATRPGIKVTKTGLQYKVIQAGKGAMPKATDWVKVDYEGKLLNGKVFDSSYKRGKPAVFPVNGLIPGWTEALEKMHVGAIWNIYIPANLAYGKAGAPMGGIGPNEMLQFKLHLIAITKKPGTK